MKIIPVLLLLAFLQTSCQEKEAVIERTSTPLSEVTTTLPDVKGHELFQARCITCHSLRYIQMQPDLKRKAWEKIVEKMRKNFGASVSDSEAVIIVDYLTEIKGKE